MCTPALAHYTFAPTASDLHDLPYPPLRSIPFSVFVFVRLRPPAMYSSELVANMFVFSKKKKRGFFLMCVMMLLRRANRAWRRANPAASGRTGTRSSCPT